VVEHFRRNAVAYTALFVALGGTSYAAVKLPNNSVGTAQIKAGAVTASKLANGAVTGTKVRDGSLAPGDFKAGSAPAGSAGPPGAPGPKGDRGSAGQNGLPGLGASAFSDDQSPAAPPGPFSAGIKQVTITTTQPGKLVITDATAEDATVHNPTGSTQNYDAAVYVDGVGVPGTFHVAGSVPANTSHELGPFTLQGSISNVPAGTHTVTLALRLESGSGDFLTSGAGRLLVVATG
jgi:hypothetical protein